MSQSVRRFVSCVVATAVIAPAFLTLLPNASSVFATFSTHLPAFVVLVVLAALLESQSAGIVTASSGRRVSSSVAAIPYLAMIPLFGPLGATLGTVLAETISGGIIRRLPRLKALFNVSQLAIAAAGAGTVYTLLGGPVSTTGISFNVGTLAAFLGSASAFFAINLTLVTFVVALDTKEGFGKTWELMTVGVWPGELAAVALALVLTFLYSAFQLLGVLALLLPLLFLHYSNHLNIKLHNLNRDLLHLIVKTIEAKDPYTSGHSVRVAHLARRIAETMRLSRRMVETIETAALLHDFGKVDVAYGEIISYAGPLSAEQRDVIRSHPIRGAELLASVSTMDPTVVRAVRHHHEKYDGTGYPDGLAREAIPLEARILMVADTIDAMLSVRPYRPALPPELVAAELLELAGQQFDPEIARVVVEGGLLVEVLHKKPAVAGVSAPEKVVRPHAPIRLKDPAKPIGETVEPKSAHRSGW